MNALSSIEFIGPIVADELKDFKLAPFRKGDVKYIVGRLSVGVKQFLSFASIWHSCPASEEEAKERLRNVLISSAITSVDPYGNRPEARSSMMDQLAMVRK